MEQPRSAASVWPAAVYLLDLLVPARCLGCRALAPAPLCPTCREQVVDLVDRCPRCAAARGGTHACWPADAPIVATVAAHDYRGPLARAVVAAKLGGARRAWPALAAPLVVAVVAARPEVDVVTWVPTPPTRSRARGFDHAHALAREVARGMGRPSARLLHARAGPTRDIFSVAGPLPGTEVLLVDDVLTTGATAWRAASALRGAGAGRISLAVLARAGSHPLGVAQRRQADRLHPRSPMAWLRPRS